MFRWVQERHLILHVSATSTAKRKGASPLPSRGGTLCWLPTSTSGSHGLQPVLGLPPDPLPRSQLPAGLLDQSIHAKQPMKLQPHPLRDLKVAITLQSSEA